MPENQTAERKFQTMLVVYQCLHDDICEFQRRQWHVVYYAALLLGGTVALLKLAREWQYTHFCPQVASWIVPVIWLSGVAFILLLESAIIKARRRIKRIRGMQLYRAYFENVLDLNEKDIRDYDSWSHDWKPLIILMMVLTGAAGLVMWFLTRHLFWFVLPPLLLPVVMCLLQKYWCPLSREWHKLCSRYERVSKWISNLCKVRELQKDDIHSDQS